MNAPCHGWQGVAGHGWPGLKNRETLLRKWDFFRIDSLTLQKPTKSLQHQAEIREGVVAALKSYKPLESFAFFLICRGSFCEKRAEKTLTDRNKTGIRLFYGKGRRFKRLEISKKNRIKGQRGF